MLPKPKGSLPPPRQTFERTLRIARTRESGAKLHAGCCPVRARPCARFNAEPRRGMAPEPDRNRAVALPRPLYVVRVAASAPRRFKRTRWLRGGGGMSGAEITGTNADRFAQVLGLAIVELWSELPRELQQTLFERAVLLGHQTERDESLREQLAQFLHDHHERTAGR